MSFTGQKAQAIEDQNENIFPYLLPGCKPFFRSGMTSNNLMKSIKTRQDLKIMTKKTSNPKQ
jgi:hypothetical protein